jgi:hypothetical protein
MRALRTLRPRDRLLLSLRAQGLTYRDMAVAAGIRESSVGRLLAVRSRAGRGESTGKEGVMRCLDDQAVQAVADGEGGDAARQHAASCDRCARLVETRRREIAMLTALGDAGADVPVPLEARLRRALAATHITGATSLRAVPEPGWRFARIGGALGAGAVVALVVFALLPRFGAPTGLSAAEVLDRSLQTMASASGVERLEYELVLAGWATGDHRIVHVIDHGNPARYHLSRLAPDGSVASAVAQDPETGRLSHMVRLDGQAYVLNLAALTSLPSLPQMAQAQMQTLIGMMQATADQKLSTVQAAEGLQYVVEIPPVMPPDAAGALDFYQARAVIDGRDFGVREFHASGALLSNSTVSSSGSSAATVSRRYPRTRSRSSLVPPTSSSKATRLMTVCPAC